MFGGGQYQVPGGHSQKGFWTTSPPGLGSRGEGPRAARRVNRRERAGAGRRRVDGER